jgi:signal transduction histidine kinase/DNA-binding response OmpR family regulator
MVELLSSSEPGGPVATGNLLDQDETIIVVDDSAELAFLLKDYLRNQGLPSISANSTTELFRLMERTRVAMVLLDIALSDRNGSEIVSELRSRDPDLGIIMVTGNTDLQVALDCLRRGADDYLTKPVNVEQFYHTVLQTLQKRRLAIENRIFQEELERTTLRTQFLHHLNLTMNSAYLDILELENVLYTILIGITSEEGLKFNRAFMALFDKARTTLQGTLAIGPDSREDGGEVWNEIKRKNIRLQDLFVTIGADQPEKDVIVNQIVRSLAVPVTDSEHPLIYACHNRTPLLVSQGRSIINIPPDLIKTLGEDTFVIVPLYSPRKELGVIIADNFVTRQPILDTDIEALEIFAGQASIAIEHSELYSDMQTKIEELEIVTQELEKSKDLLVKAERYSALGQMSAQLVHALRNPITSIGGTARLLNKRISEQTDQRFLKVLTKEAAKLEATLTDLFSFVSQSNFKKSEQPLAPLVRKSVMIFYNSMKKNNIDYEVVFNDGGVILDIDGEQMRQVFMHLIRNAIEAMQDGGILHVRTHSGDGLARVVISDSGSGIAEGDLSHVTDPFYTTKTYGTGMGLTLVEQILEGHDATFTLVPNEFKGTTATVTLPIPR